MTEPKTYNAEAKSPGRYMAVHGGRKVYLLDPKPEDFQPYDTAHALAHEHRYSGQYGPYSVAQHSVLVSECIKKMGGTHRQQLAGLHHDDSESVLGDMPSPVKSLCPDFRKLEALLEDQLEVRYGIDLGEQIVKEADRIVFCAEVRWLVPPSAQWLYGEHGDPGYQMKYQPEGEALAFWGPDKAIKSYLALHQRLESLLKETR